MMAQCAVCGERRPDCIMAGLDPVPACSRCLSRAAEADAQALLDWWAAWAAAWDALEAQDVVDAGMDRLYYRAAANAQLDGIEASQAAMRGYLLGWLGASRPESVTTVSLAARAARQHKR